MTKNCPRCALFAAGLLWLSASFAQEKAKPEQYSATWAVVGGAGGGTTVPIDIRINRYNTDAEIKELAELLKEAGQGELRKKLEKDGPTRVKYVK